jgi:hypothetical protein
VLGKQYSAQNIRQNEENQHYTVLEKQHSAQDLSTSKVIKVRRIKANVERCGMEKTNNTVLGKTTFGTRPATPPPSACDE